MAIYPTSSFEFETIDQGIEIFEDLSKGHVYSRYGNPTMELVADKIALMECHGLNLEASAILVSSGMSAISTAILGLLNKGDQILTQGNLYGGTTELFLKLFGPKGMDTQFINLKDLDLVESTLKANPAIKLLYFESPANPSMDCVDLKALAALGKQYGVLTMIDNTFCTPYLQQPFKFGVDLVIHSTTKFLNGHGNSTAGVIIGTDKSLVEGKIWTAMKLLGTNCNPFDAWITGTGMKTLALRMDRHSSNALAIAQFLEAHSKVEKVNYPGLESHPDHELAKAQMSDFGGMLSFELKGGLDAGIRFMNAIQFCTLAPTLGDIDTLILHPASMSHKRVDREVRYRNGITDGLIRLSVGIENPLDLIEDLAQAIDA